MTDLQYCKNCKRKTKEIFFLGRAGNVKLFSVVCHFCKYEYVFRINSKGKKYLRTGNLLYA